MASHCYCVQSGGNCWNTRCGTHNRWVETNNEGVSSRKLFKMSNGTSWKRRTVSLISFPTAPRVGSEVKAGSLDCIHVQWCQIFFLRTIMYFIPDVFSGVDLTDLRLCSPSVRPRWPRRTWRLLFPAALPRWLTVTGLNPHRSLPSLFICCFLSRPTAHALCAPCTWSLFS